MKGKTRNKTKYALILIDFISDFDFEDGKELFENALPAAEKLAEFKKTAKKVGIPVIYVNDNFGKWQEDFKTMVKYCFENSDKGKKIVELLKPEEDDFYVLKPKHSAFYKTVFELLLENLEAENLILTGVSTDICVLFTANDAYMRDFNIIIPKDCVAAVTKENTENALVFMKRNLKAEITDTKELTDKLNDYLFQKIAS